MSLTEEKPAQRLLLDKVDGGVQRKCAATATD